MSDEQFLDDLRVRINDAHTGMPGAGSPPPDLWSRILSDHDEGRAKTMSTTTLSEPAMPQSWRSVNRQVSSSKTGGRSYALAAAVLVLALIGGVFVSNQRGPGGNDFDDLRYAALPVSPDASAVASGACQIDALSIDEVMAIVEDPYVNMDYQRLNIAGFPDFLTQMTPLNLPETSGESMLPEEERAVRSIVKTYLECRETGTMGQVFALMSPNKVQQMALAPFPAFRTQEDVRAYLEVIVSLPARDVMSNPLFDMDVDVEPATGEDAVLMSAGYPDYPVAYVGTQGVDGSGNVLAVSNAHDSLITGKEVIGFTPTLGAISLVRYPGVEQWFVHDDEAWFRADTSPSLGTPQAEACSVEPISASDMNLLLDNPDRYTQQKFGVSPFTAEGLGVLDDIRNEPDSLVLAGVTMSTDQVMLIIPQEGVLPSATTYFECWQYGTAGQAFTLMAPHMIAEYDSYVRLPRGTQAMQALLDAPARELPASERLMPTFVLDDGREVTPSDPTGNQGYAQLAGGLEVAFVGSYTYAADGQPLIGANIDDRALDWSQGTVDVDGRMSFGALTLIRYPGSDQWLVYDHWIELEPAAIE